MTTEQLIKSLELLAKHSEAAELLLEAAQRLRELSNE